MKRFLACCLMVALVLSILTVCFSALASSAPGTKVELSYWYTAAEGNLALYTWHEDLIENYMRDNPNVTIVPMNIGDGNQYLTKVTTEMAAGNSPDILEFWLAGRFEPFVKAGRMLPLNDFVASDPDLQKVISTDSLQLTTFDDQFYSLPMSLTGDVLWYNKKIFNELNLEVPKTYDELLAVGAYIRENTDILPMVMGNADLFPGAMSYMAIFDRLNGMELYEKVILGKEPLFNDPAFAEAGKMLFELKEKGVLDQNCNSITSPEAQSLFKEGRAAMIFDGSWRVASFYDALGEDLDFVNYPEIAGGKGSAQDWLVNFDQGIGICSSTKNLEAAQDFVRYIFSEQQQRDLGERGHIICTNVPLDPAKIPDINIKLMETLQNTRNPLYMWDVQLGSNLGAELQNTVSAILAGEDPVKMFDLLQKIAEAEWNP